MVPLESETFYHIFNRANGNEKIFIQPDNYRYFLSKYLEYIDPIADTFCYCLMPNHFHFLIRIKKDAELKDLEGFKKRAANLEGFENFPDFSKQLSLQFSNFFNSYSKAFNKQNKRKGSLFMKNFKRKAVKDEKYLRKLVHYIHLNPVEANFCNVPEKWANSSYKFLISEEKTFLKRDEVIDWFGDLVNFKYIHMASPDETGIG